MKKDFSLSNMNDWMRKHLFFTGLIFFAIYGVIHGFDMWPETASSFPFVLGQIICVGLIMVWIISVRWRIVRTSIRREIIIMGFLMILWFLLRFSRYRAFFGDGDIRRYFWYCYYIPQMIVPVITFLLAMRIGLPYKSKLNSGWNILFVIAAILILAVLTNDIHQLVFTFPEGTVWGSDQVKRGPLYFAAIIWLFSLMVMAVMVLFFKSRVHKSKQDIWKPLFVILFAIIYGAWYIHGQIGRAHV